MMYIPIGEDCNSARWLQNKNLRKFSTICDWIIISPNNILKLYENDFKHFCEKKNLIEIRKSNRRFKHAEIEVLDTYYNALIPHYFNNIDEDYDKIKKMFDKRILRFKEYLKKNIPITFVYTPTTQQNTIPIDLKFGKNHFDIIYPLFFFYKFSN